MPTLTPREISAALADDKQEWSEALESVYAEYGAQGVREILRRVQDRALELNVDLSEATLNTPYVNTIPPEEEPTYPGNIQLEERLEKIIRWNAIAMVLRAQDSGAGLGGHIATYASCATMLEVGFNHIFQGFDGGNDPDMVLPQPHAAPGIYARALLEGRLTLQQVRNYRRELAPEGGLSSYPHPRSMPEFWEMPNASMGLSTPAAIYEARFAKYLENRGLKPKSQRKIWCFIGDGESDEPEVLGTINIASREKLDNLILVINCNLQRLDGPVRGNGKIIQELERDFRGADWNVIKVIWGSGWDNLLARDRNGVLRRRMDECLDGDYQRYSVLPGDVQREHWVEGNPELEAMMRSLTDEEVRSIKRGGHDHKKVYAAYDRAMRASGKPTVILIKTVKGDGMGAQGKNTAHQFKNMDGDERVRLAREFGIPLPDAAARAADFYVPGEDSEEIRYLRERRRALSGPVPRRRQVCPALQIPALEAFADLLKGSQRPASTTMVMVRLLSSLLRMPEIKKYVVPIVPDEARTFGMDVLFKVAGIYSPQGQQYQPVDADSIMAYREAADGQILQEGICETGAMASFMAAGSAYAVHGLPMIPFYIFYSMFGFQRVGDMIWSCGDMMCRGFLLGGTAGRTTLNGEGLQHQDGHSHMLAATVPNLKSYDPAFGFEVAIIVRAGLHRMYELQLDEFYYLTLYNENYAMASLAQVAQATGRTEADIAQGVLAGGYCLSRDADFTGQPTAHLLASGSILQQALRARELLLARRINVTIWSITSYIELARDAERCAAWNRTHPQRQPRTPYVARLFADQSGVFVAVSDYMKMLASSVAAWIPGRFEVLGTDGYGLSESRDVLRRHFKVDAACIAGAALSALVCDGQLAGETYTAFMAEMGLSDGDLDG